MKSDVTVLYPNEKVAERVTAYSAQHSTPLPKYITDFHEEVVRGPERSEYLTSNFQSQAHVLLARMIGAKRGECAFTISLLELAHADAEAVLEVGVFVGYSAMVWAHAVGPEGKVTGLEFSPDYAKKAEEAFEANAVKNVEVIVGDALESCVPLPLVSGPLPANTCQPPQAQPHRALRPHLHRRPKVGLPLLPLAHPRAVRPRRPQPPAPPRRPHRRRQRPPPRHRGRRQHG